VPDGLVVRADVPLQYVAPRDQHAGRAEAALQRVEFVKVPAQQRHQRIAAQSFKREDGAAVGHGGEREA
jgi:hypothetical protein